MSIIGHDLRPVFQSLAVATEEFVRVEDFNDFFIEFFDDGVVLLEVFKD